MTSLLAVFDEEADQASQQNLPATSCKHCTKVIGKGKSRRNCEKCGWNYHVKCMQMHSIFENHLTIQVCNDCIPKANKPIRLSASAPTSRATSPQRQPQDALSQILAKLGKLDSIEKTQSDIVKSTEANSEVISGIEARLTTMEKSLSPLKEIPRLIARVSTVEEDVAALKAEQASINNKLTVLLQADASTSSSATPAAADTAAILELQAANKDLQQQLRNVVTAQSRLTADVVLSGIAHNDSTSLRSLSYAALKVLDPDISERDILAVRPMIERRTESLTADAATQSSTAPLAVTLSSRVLMHSLISSKIKRRKLHTRELDANLLLKARAPNPLPDALINLNELLPSEVHRLRIAVRAAAKQHNFYSFVRNGRVHVKKGKDSRATVINSHEELKTFLDSLKTTA